MGYVDVYKVDDDFVVCIFPKSHTSATYIPNLHFQLKVCAVLCELVFSYRMMA